ncbi:hypothetical protein PVL29_006136 [Vitis rotundifolia]|uniref:Uncharacterized protein n=1 Tax=Vitis rotundifolia TaxID=103349 RepID=A0AA39E0I7_VITRO|nr:hypothetical protein PVL29_006136 [Vitis rotundifolia]
MWWLLSRRRFTNWGWWLVFWEWFLSLGRFANWGWWLMFWEWLLSLGRLVLRRWLLKWRRLGVMSKRWSTGENHHSKQQY